MGSHMEKVRLDSYLTSLMKTKSISIIHINVKNQMIKLLERKLLMVEKDFLDKIQKH